MCSVFQSRPVDSGGTQILVLGLDGAGKTSLLHCFSMGGLEQDVQPTQGFNAVSISRDDLHVEFLESKSLNSEIFLDVKLRNKLWIYFLFF